MDLYETLRERATNLSADAFVAWVKHPVLLLYLDEDDDEECTQLVVHGAKPIAINQSRDQVARMVTKQGRSDGPITIGRTDECDIVVKHSSISKQHAEILIRPDRSLGVRDVGSRNGVFVNEQRVANNAATPLVAGDELRIGAVEGSLVYPLTLFRMLRGEIKVSPWRALRDRRFALLWSGQTISQLGDGLYRIALMWWVLTTTGSGVALGALALFSTIPMLAFLLVGGVVVDRMSRARVMLFSDLARGFVTGAIALLAITGRLELWHVYVAAVAFGLADAFVVPAYTALIPQIVRRSDLSSANGLTALSWQIGGVGGAALGALLVAWIGTSITFAIESLSFFVCAATLLPVMRHLSSRAPIAAVATPRSVMSDMREGIAIIRSDPWLWMCILAGAVNMAIDQAAFVVALPYLIKNVLHQGVGALGAVETVFFIGSLLGTIWMSRRIRLRRRGVIWISMCLTLGLCMVCFGLPIPIYAIGLVALVRGVAAALSVMIWMDTLQERVPQAKLGLVASIDTFGSTVALPFGLAAIGWLTDHAAMHTIFIGGGMIVISVALTLLLHPTVRGVD